MYYELSKSMMLQLTFLFLLNTPEWTRLVTVYWMLAGPRFTVRLQSITNAFGSSRALTQFPYPVSFGGPGARTWRQAFAVPINDRFAFDILHISSHNSVD
jgi:hypothetical protein